MRRAAPLAAALLLAAALPRAAQADVGDYLGKPIASVRLMLESREVSDSEFLQIVETRPGAPLSMVEVHETVTRLFALGRFEDVQVHASEVPGGVDLVYDLIPVHPVYRIEFAGQLGGGGIDTSRMRRDLLERYGASPPVGRAPDLVRVIEDNLRAEGYQHPRVTPTARLEHAPDRATLVFTIQPGPRTLIGDVQVSGTPGMSPTELLKLLNVSTGSPYRRDALATRIDRYVDNRRSLGYFEAALTPSVALVDDDRTANLTVNAVQGPHVRVAFAGDPVAKDELNALVPIEREGSADEDLLEDSSNRIEDYLRSQGYRDASAPHAREDQDGELLITFTVRRGPQYRVAHVEITGNTTFSVAEFGSGLQLRVGQPFSAAKLDADVGAIEAFYHRQGFTGVRVQANPESAPHDASAVEVPVTLRVDIVENARTIVRSVHIRGNAGVSESDLVRSLALQPGQPLYLPQLAADRDALEQQYANLGFQNATVESDAGLSADRARADVVYTVREGPRLFVDHILIVGNVRTKTETIERELQFKSGDPLGLGAVNDTERRLAALGLFRRTDITTIGHGEALRDVLIRVDEAPVTTISYGGGGEVDQVTVSDANGNAQTQLQVAPRVFFEVGRRNLFGKNRSVTLFTRYSIRPQETVTTVSQTPGEPTTTSTFRLAEYRILGTFREPRILGTQADAYITGVVEQQHRTTFDFARRSVSADVGRRLTRTVSATGNYQIQRVRVFNENVSPQDQSVLDRAFPQVRLSSFSGSILRSTRNDPLDPSNGTALSVNEQLAARAIGSEVGFLKSYLRAQWFHQLPHSRGIVLATNATLGIANPFPREVPQPDGSTVIVSDIPASERYFAGGDTTVRGFPLDQLGTPETIDANGFPLGGEGLVILNGELRVPYHKLELVGFLDSGNVFAAPSDINLGELRSAVGFGVRYKSPVGPIRVDLGFKVHRQVVAGKLEPLTAIHISLGQAF